MVVIGQHRANLHTQTQLAIELNGTPLNHRYASDLVDARVDLAVRAIGRARLRFIDRDGATGPKLLELGTAVTISSVEPKRKLLTGTITALDVEAGVEGTTVTATVSDHAYKLSRNRGVETFSQQSFADVISRLAQQAGLRVATPLPTEASSQVFEWLLQVDSHLGLLDEIAGRLGLDWAVSGDTLSLWSPARGIGSQCDLLLGEDLLTFSARRADLAPTEFKVRGWDPQKRMAGDGLAKSKTERDGFAPRPGNQPVGPAVVLAAHEVSASSQEAVAVAKGLAAATGRVSGRGRGHFVPDLVPGGEVQVRGAESADGAYYVREVTHQVDGTSLRTSFVVGDRAPIQLSDPWGGPARTSSMRRTGLTIGIVDDLNDPDKLGRVRLHLPGLSDLTSSAWARVLSLGAGENHGLVILPDVNDEVLVAFEDDDVRRPVVLGGLFSKRTKIAGPPAVVDRRLVSRHLVSGKGHRLELADGDGRNAEFVQMVLAGDKKRIQLGKDASTIAADDAPLTISSGGASIEFDGHGGITIDAQTVTIKAAQALKLESMEIIAKANVKFEASATQTTISANGPMAVKGQLVQINGAMVKIN